MTTQATLITLCYHGDFEMCRQLCASVDAFAPGVRHRLYVPRRDLPLFADLASDLRAIATQESLLPAWLWKAPLAGLRWSLPRRDVYLTPFTRPVRDRIALQIMRIAASLAYEDALVVHVDGDVAFVRPLAPEHIIQNGRARLYAGAAGRPRTRHADWHAAASRLLGLPSPLRESPCYIDRFVVWRRHVLEAMVARIESVTARPWRVALAQTPHVQADVLYGAFAERGLGLDQASLFATSQSLCHARWPGVFADEAALARAIGPTNILCTIRAPFATSPARRAQGFKTARAVA